MAFTEHIGQKILGDRNLDLDETKNIAEQTGCSEPRDRVSVAFEASVARGR